MLFSGLIDLCVAVTAISLRIEVLPTAGTCYRRLRKVLWFGKIVFRKNGRLFSKWSQKAFSLRGFGVVQKAVVMHWSRADQNWSSKCVFVERKRYEIEMNKNGFFLWIEKGGKKRGFFPAVFWTPHGEPYWDRAQAVYFGDGLLLILCWVSICIFIQYYIESCSTISRVLLCCSRSFRICTWTGRCSWNGWWTSQWRTIIINVFIIFYFFI